MSLGGQTVVWDPDPEPSSRGPADIFSPGTCSPFRQESSALRLAPGISQILDISPKGTG